ncbi:unnamed protein product [Schistosoma guineensis]|nr:unnamed protein product [Schistosoma guineensis]
MTWSLWYFQRNRERFKHLLNKLIRNSVSSGQCIVIPTCFHEHALRSLLLEGLSHRCFSIVRFDVCNAIHVEDNQFTVFFKDTTGRIIMLPKLSPNFCKDSEVVKLRESPSGVCHLYNNKRNSTNFTMIFLKSIDQENRYYHSYLENFIFQETVQCYERGKLLADVRMIYKNFIESLPIKFSSLFTELFCQEILCQKTLQLNEQHVNETMNIFHKIKAMCETNKTYKMEEKGIAIKVYSQILNVPKSNISNLAVICFKLQQTVEIWGFIGAWLIELLKLYDTTILNRIDKIIWNDWYIHFESVEKDLYIHDQECKLHLQKLDSMLKSLDTYFKHNRLMNTQNCLNDLLDLLSNLLEVSNECLDLFNGERVLNIEEKLVTIDHIQNYWFEMFYQSSHCDELMLEDSTNYEKEITIQLQKELTNMIASCRIQLHGENGIVQLLTKIIRNIKDFIRFIQFNTENYVNHKNSKTYSPLRLNNQSKITMNELELHCKNLCQQYDYWMETIKNILHYKWQIYDNELPSKQISRPYSVDETCTVAFDKWNQINDNKRRSLFKCQQNLIKWLELIKNRVNSISEMRNEQILLEQINIIQQLNKQITNNNTNDVNGQRYSPFGNNSSIQNDQLNKQNPKLKKNSFYELTKSLFKLGSRVIKHLDQKNIWISYDHKTMLSRLNSFKLYAERWIEYLNKIENFNDTQTFKNVKDYLNVHSGSRKFIGVYNQSIIRYLQSTDGTIREHLLANTTDGQSVQNNDDTEFMVQLSNHYLMNTKLAYLTLLKQNELTELLNKTEMTTMEFDKETTIVEQQWIQLCNTIESLQYQFDMKQNELKRLKDILQIKMEVLSE